MGVKRGNLRVKKLYIGGETLYQIEVRKRTNNIWSLANVDGKALIFALEYDACAYLFGYLDNAQEQQALSKAFRDKQIEERELAKQNKITQQKEINNAASATATA